MSQIILADKRRMINKVFTAFNIGDKEELSVLTRFSIELWNSLIFFSVSLSLLTSLMYMARS